MRVTFHRPAAFETNPFVSADRASSSLRGDHHAQLHVDVALCFLHENERPPSGLLARFDWVTGQQISRALVTGRIGAAGGLELVPLASPWTSKLLLVSWPARITKFSATKAPPAWLARVTHALDGLRAQSILLGLPPLHLASHDAHDEVFRWLVSALIARKHTVEVCVYDSAGRATELAAIAQVERRRRRAAEV